MRRRMSSIIAELEQTLKIEQAGIYQLQRDLDNTNKRLKEVAAENESLRMDKKWLQAMHSNLLQSMINKGI